MNALIFAFALFAGNAGNAQLSREMRAELDADVLLMSPTGQRFALSASLCADERRLADIDARIDLMTVPSSQLRRAWLLTLDAIDAAELALAVLGVEAQECGGDVARVAACLADVEPDGCETYAVEVVAALRLRGVRR
jgi:hypothetical protein